VLRPSEQQMAILRCICLRKFNQQESWIRAYFPPSKLHEKLGISGQIKSQDLNICNGEKHEVRRSTRSWGNTCGRTEVPTGRNSLFGLNASPSQLRQPSAHPSEMAHQVATREPCLKAAVMASMFSDLLRSSPRGAGEIKVTLIRLHLSST
jgi:hypothetical protein